MVAMMLKSHLIFMNGWLMVKNNSYIIKGLVCQVYQKMLEQYNIIEIKKHDRKKE